MSKLSLQKRESAKVEYFESLFGDIKCMARVLKNDIPKSLRILDFGLGWGHWALAAKAMGYRVAGASELECLGGANPSYTAMAHAVKVVSNLKQKLT